jgi:hypothetical protein
LFDLFSLCHCYGALIFKSQVSEFVTGDLFQLHAVLAAVATGMYGLTGPQYDSMKTLAGGAVIALALRLKSDGASVDTVKANGIQTLVAVVLAILAFVE